MPKGSYRRRSHSNSRKAQETSEPRVLTPAERARIAKFGATLIGARTPVFDEVVERRQAAEEEALRIASMGEEDMLRDVIPSDVIHPHITEQPEATPDPKK